MAKKKSKPQTDNNKTEDQFKNQQAMDNAGKIDILKSLNSKLLKETKESRQQVDSLTSQLNVSTKRAALLELEKDLVYDFVYVLVDQMQEVDGRKFYWDWAAVVDKIDELQIEMVRVLKEKSNVEEERGKNEAEIVPWNSRLNTIIRGIVRGRQVFTRVCNERDKIMAQLDARVNEAEKREADLVESNGTVDELKWDIEKMKKEKVAIEEEKNEQMRKVNELQNMVSDLKKLTEMMKMEKEGLLLKVADLEKKCVGSSNEEAEMGIGGLVQEIVQRLNDEKKVAIEEEKNEQRRKVNELQNMVSYLKRVIEMMKMEKEGLLLKVADLEKKCVGSSNEEAGMGIGGLVQEKKKMQEIVKRLNDEKELAVKEMEEAFKMLDEAYEEKMKTENAKIQRENDIVRLKEHLGILKDTILSLENASICQNDKIKQLEAELVMTKMKEHPL